MITLTLWSLLVGQFAVAKYVPEWDSLDSRPNPEWYDQAKIGVSMHWGVYSAIPFGNEWFWSNWKAGFNGYAEFMAQYHSNATYQEFANDFKCEHFKPEEWVELFVESGAKYVFLTAKHHNGFTLFPSTFGWNSVDVGPHRDLVQEVRTAIKEKSSLAFGFFYSFMEWFNPMFINDQNNGFKSQEFVEKKMWPELQQLVKKYQPDILWVNGEGTEETYWKSKEFLTWLFNDSPVKDAVVVNDLWGTGTRRTHGGVWTDKKRYAWHN